MSVSESAAILIVGPTGTGKSVLALELALKLHTGIVNADSIQVYKDLVVGSAQPSREDFKIAPHYLYGYLPAGASLTAAAYRDDVAAILKNKFQADPVLICGGSGFYIQALEKGMFDVPTLTEAQRAQVDEFINERGWELAHQELLKRDPNVKIHANDHYRTRRALEILLISNKQPSQIAAHSEAATLHGKRIIKIGIDLEKEQLRERIQKRTQQMLAAGWIEEVEKLLSAGHRNWAALRSVGYNEVIEFLDGKLPQNQMIEKIVTSNMQLIKKQRTWFKRDKDIQWYTPSTTAQAVEFVLRSVKT